MAPSIHTCPDCSRVIQFSHTDTNIIQCACGAVLQLVESVVLKKSTLPAINFSNDLVAVGSKGVWNGLSFKITGRFRAWSEESVVNYWTMIFDNNDLGYLCEGYGLYSILIKTNDYKNLSSRLIDTLKPGHTEKLNATNNFLLKSKQQINKLEIEGEVCLPVNKQQILVCEFASKQGIQATLIEFLEDYIITYNTYYTSFASLQLTGLRQPENNYKEFTCSKCKKVHKLKTWPYLQSFVCSDCSSFYYLDNGNCKVIGKKTTPGNPDLEIGSNGMIDGILYEVIGYAWKEDNTSYHSRWKEYTLYNAQQGFAFLSEFQGHWIFLQEKGDAPVLVSKKEDQFTFNDEPFKLYNDYGYKVIDAKGEFPYHLLDTNNIKVREFISPPEMWSEEKSKDDITWFHGSHVSKHHMEKNFVSPGGFPWREGVGMIDPKGFINPSYLISMSVVVILIFMFAHFIFSASKLDKQIMDTQLYFDSSNTANFVSEKFELTKAKSNLKFDIAAPVNNSWVSVNATLVNADNGTEYDLQEDIEFYSGYDEGYWSEGDTKQTGYISSIPRGTYLLQVDGQRESFMSANSFYITVTYDTPNDKNLGVMLLVVLLWPIGKCVLIHYNERRRWYNSAYSPYTYEN